MAKRDYYEVLGVPRTAAADAIKSAYRKLARTLHPDVNKEPGAAERFHEVQQAYEALSDPDKRAVYDRFGHAGAAGARASAGGAGGGPGGRSQTYTWSNIGGGAGPGVSDADIGDIFEEIFGGSGGAGFGRAGAAAPGGRNSTARARSTPSRGRDINRDVTIGFLTAAQGGTEVIKIRRGGRTQTIDVTIPKGVKPGARLRVRGAGAPSSGSAPTGDLILTVRIGEHPLFRRDGLDLVLDLPVTIAEAVLGAEVTIPTLSGQVEVTVPPGSSSGRTLRLRGRGLEDEKGGKGDLRAIVKIMAPAELSDADREALEKLKPRLGEPRASEVWREALRK